MYHLDSSSPTSSLSAPPRVVIPASPANSTGLPVDVIQWLDDVHRNAFHRLEDTRQIEASLTDLFVTLHEIRSQCEPQVWAQHVADIRRHPIKELAHQDPFTRRAFSKPRGYAGDAVMLDYIYGREEGWDPPPATEIGRKIFEFTTNSPASLGVLARRGYIADLLDLLVNDVRRPHVLAVAAGHVREAEITAAFKRRKFGRFLALDGDKESLQEAHRCYGRFGVTTLHANIRRLFTGKMDLGAFDLIYSMGLFDYLEAATARRLVDVLFEMLRPSGRLVVGNFMPGIRDIGYMESLMDWHLVYRTRQEMMDITMGLHQADIDDIRIYAEENQNIMFLEVRRSP